MTLHRAQLSQDASELRPRLRELLTLLEAEKGWYGSVYFERRASKTLSANLKQTQIADQVSQGVVLRIYDGYTLYEEACDHLEIESLKEAARKMALRVRKTSPASGAPRRVYGPPSWAERLKVKLDPEITDQIAKGAGPDTPVHFGIRYTQDPRQESAAHTLERLKNHLDRCKKIAAEVGLAATDLTYAVARQSCSEEEAIFHDRETDMSQAIFRMAFTLITMSGGDRTYQRPGGLGGLEVVGVSDAAIREQLQDLLALKKAERLKPGRYRVLFGPALSGVLAHEAFGHSQEADTCARGRSKAWDLHLSGKTVGNTQATILNNPAAFTNGVESYAAWGSYFFDEEGWLAQSQVLLDQGVLKPPMTNLTSALRLGVPRSANGKRESWANGVYTRQTNTYFSAGDRRLDELMGEIDYGFVAMHAAGGMEDPKGMGIQVGISFLNEVRHGKLTGKVFKGPAGGDIQMTGYTPDILHSILGKSKVEYDSEKPDRAEHPFNDAGGCGKYHKEFVYAGCGGPYMLLDHVTLG